MELARIIFTLLTSMVLCWIITPMFIQIAHKLKLLDEPDHRKLHEGSIPPFGGLTIFIAVVITLFIWLPMPRFIGLSIFTGAALFTVILGIRDDIIPTKALMKLSGQIVVAIIIVYLGDVRFHKLYGILGIQEIGDISSYLVSIFFIVLTMNAMNLIDGINGLAASLGILYFGVFCIWFFVANEIVYAVIAASMSGALIAFLRFNLVRPQMFLGDTGSLLIGMGVSLLMIQFIEFNDPLLIENPIKFESAAAFGLCLLIIPFFDTFRVFFVRLVLLRKSPFSGDKNHIHHLFLKLGFSHLQTTSIIVGINLIFLGVGLILDHVGDYILLSVVIALCIILFVLLDFFLARKLSGVKDKKTLFK